MKRIYAIYCTLRLTDQPEWLGSFRTKYDEDYPLHITLKQMAYLDEAEYPKVKTKLEAILHQSSSEKSDTQVIFDTVVSDAHDSDDNKGYIYIFASKRNQNLDQLQREIREQLAEYSDYVLEESQKYEYEFKPHITIARRLGVDSFAEALNKLPSNVHCVGEIINVTLSFVESLSIEETSSAKNLSVYKF